MGFRCAGSRNVNRSRTVVDSARLIRPCPACGFMIFARAFGSEETCPVCGWVDDYFQLAHPDFMLGANSGLSLREAQASALAAFPMTVKVLGTFLRDSRWRPLAVNETPTNGASVFASPVCYLSLPDPEKFEPYWLVPPTLDV